MSHVWRAAGEALDAVFRKEAAAVLKTMLLGDKSDLDGEVADLYREAGILHILAISGLHISILGMGLYELLRRLRLPALCASVLCALMMLWYGFFVGMPVSAQAGGCNVPAAAFGRKPGENLRYADGTQSLRSPDAAAAAALYRVQRLPFVFFGGFGNCAVKAGTF